MKRWGKLINLAMVLILLMGIGIPATAQAQDGPPKAQPQLIQIARIHPNQQVNIIVQKLVDDTSVEGRMAELGGKYTKSLSIINAFAGHMTAQTALQLAREPGVRWISLDAPVEKTGGPDGTVTTTALINAYIKGIGADKLWAEGYQGSSVGVAVIDSGVSNHFDFSRRLVANTYTNSSLLAGGGLNTTPMVFADSSMMITPKAAPIADSPAADPVPLATPTVESSMMMYWSPTMDNYGHGTHIAGIIGGNGANSGGKYIGVAPKAKLINVKVTDDAGMAYMSDVVDGLQWILNNRSVYNIRVINLSMNCTLAESYNVNPLDAALEILWFNKIVVVVSAGNSGAGEIFPPANDPFVITVGAVDDRGTANISDDVIPAYSAFGTTTDGFAKPDLVAPGSNIISTLSRSGSVLATDHPANKVSGASTYFRMSGTSMASAVTAGAAALILQVNPNLTPDQVKYRLVATANTNWGGYNKQAAGAGYLDVYAAAKSTETSSANTGLNASRLLWTGAQPVAWNSVSWNSVSWNSVSWNSVSWNSVSWNSDYWGQ